MRDYDLLDAMFPQEGGANEEQSAPCNRIAALPNQTEASPTAAEKRIHITVDDQSGERVKFHFKSTLPMADLVTYYHEAPPPRYHEVCLSKYPKVSPSKNHEAQPSKCHEEPSPAENKVHIAVKDRAGNCMHFLIKPTTPLAKLMACYNEAKSHAPGFLRFYSDGQRVLDTDTPESVS